MKVCFVGAGSTYTPELVSGLARERERLGVSELALHDIDEERLDVVGGLAGRMLARDGFEGKLELTGDLDRAIEVVGDLEPAFVALTIEHPLREPADDLTPLRVDVVKDEVADVDAASLAREA